MPVEAVLERDRRAPVNDATLEGLLLAGQAGQNEGSHVLVGEVGVENAGSDTTQAMEYFYQNDQNYDNLSWTPWHWYEGDAGYTTGDGGYDIDDCQNPTNLSNFGQHVWDNSHDTSRDG